MPAHLLAPWRRPAPTGPLPSSAGSSSPTRILDWRHPRVLALAAEAGATLVTAHRLVAARVRPVYGLDERQPVSTTLALGRGSCSQRLAVLEAVARATGIPTRVRGLLVDGRFWYPRFPRSRPLIPARVVLAWPEFRTEGRWVPVSEIYGDLGSLRDGGAFANDGGETLFDAVARTAIDWDGATCSSCDLSGQVLADLGYFDARDDLFAAYGQTVCSVVAVASRVVVRVTGR